MMCLPTFPVSPTGSLCSGNQCRASSLRCPCLSEEPSPEFSSSALLHLPVGFLWLGTVIFKRIHVMWGYEFILFMNCYEWTGLNIWEEVCVDVCFVSSREMPRSGVIWQIYIKSFKESPNHFPEWSKDFLFFRSIETGYLLQFCWRLPLKQTKESPASFSEMVEISFLQFWSWVRPRAERTELFFPWPLLDSPVVSSARLWCPLPHTPGAFVLFSGVLSTWDSFPFWTWHTHLFGFSHPS